MSAVALEAQKAGLAREILCLEDESIINDMWQLLKQWKPAAQQQKTTGKRPLGILKGKAKVVFHDDWEMTTEELLGLK